MARKPKSTGIQLSEAAKVLLQRLTEQITSRRERDGQGHCYFVYDGDRKLAGPFPDTAAGKAAAEARAQRERDRRAARG